VSGILNPEIIALLLLDVVFLFFGFIAFILSLKIALFWDSNATTKRQYTLVKQSYLGAVIIKYILALKIPLILFFVFILDELSTILNGAMCAAGVINATPYGTYLLVLKIFNIYLFLYWLYLHKVDEANELQPYTRIKFALFSVLFFPFLAEIVLEFALFSSLDVNTLVDCCGTIYSFASQSYLSVVMRSFGSSYLVGLFYFLFLAIIMSYVLKKENLFALLNLVFIVVSLATLIMFFGTYIYEMPTHHCPFCFLQKDYNYVGYFLYTFLFLGTFHGLAVAFVPATKKMQQSYYKTSLLFLSLYVLSVTFYVVRYVLVNGVWL